MTSIKTPLPADSFKESGTSVNTVLVTYNKPGAVGLQHR